MNILPKEKNNWNPLELNNSPKDILFSMRKVGDILKKRRIERNFTFEDIERRTKIRKKFIQAIESGDYSLFSSSTYLRGFIKNYSDFLNLPTTEILAIFRREFAENEKIGIVPKGLSEPLQVPLTRLTPTKISFITAVILLILFFVYLIRSYISVTGVPELTVKTPEAGARVTSEKIVVEGKTDPNARLTINNQEVLINQDGSFSTEVTINKNTTILTIVAENKKGKRAVVERVIEVELP